jgi:NAD(P)-dependent dehydrogenase (short-subunit alcohol dehydrogenase family)
MDEFIDKVVLITGAGRGWGRELALAFSSLGASVAANDINPINLDETVELIHQAGGSATSYVFDIAKRMPIEAMVAQVLDYYGQIDILVNHAAVEPDESVLEMDEWEFHRTLDVNLGGPFFTMQQVGRVMRQQGGGNIVNLISMAENKDFRKGHAAFTASQAGLIGLTQAAAGEFEAYHIRVNAVYHGPLEITPVPSPSWDITAFHHWKGALPDLNLDDRLGRVSLVLFACSTAASTLTGQVLSLPPGIGTL